MKLTFYSDVYNFSIDGEKLFIQILLASFSLLFIYIVCRSMRIVEEHHKKTSKNILKLKARLDIVLAQKGPICENVLYHNVMRCRSNIVAGYLKDLTDDKQYDQQKYSIIVHGMPQNASNKQTFTRPSVPVGRLHPTSKLNSEKHPGKESSIEKSVFDEVNILGEKSTTQENFHKQENNLAVNSTSESTIFKTLEGPMRRKTARLNPFEKRRTKTPKWNIMQGLKNVHDVCNENLKVCSALNSTKSPFKVSSLKKPSLKNPHMYNEIKIYTALTNTKSPFKVSSLKKPQLHKMCLDTSKAKLHSKRSNSNIQSMIAEVKDSQQNKNMVNVDQETNFEKNENGAQELEIKTSEDRSVCSSGFESDCVSEPSLQVPINSAIKKPISILTTINEESAEENCSIDSI